MTLILRMAWRNIWRHKRRTWLTATAMIFSNVLLVFMIALQFGSYDMMIDNTLKMFSGHLQVQAEGYQDNPDAMAKKIIDGVYHSGDLGHVRIINGKRYLYFDGRTDDWIEVDRQGLISVSR